MYIPEKRIMTPKLKEYDSICSFLWKKETTRAKNKR